VQLQNKTIPLFGFYYIDNYMVKYRSKDIRMTIYDFNVKNIDGKDISMQTYKYF